jgi:hypothetical protein
MGGLSWASQAPRAVITLPWLMAASYLPGQQICLYEAHRSCRGLPRRNAETASQTSTGYAFGSGPGSPPEIWILSRSRYSTHPSRWC